MDIERMSHSGYRTSVAIAVVLSCMVVTIAAVLGRGTLNLKGALLLDEPTNVTVISLVEPKIGSAKISNIIFLRKEKRDGDERQSYAYQVSLSDKSNYLVRLGFNISKNEWSLTQFDLLHGEAKQTADEEEHVMEIQ